MGKGGNSSGVQGNVEEENMAAWLVGVNTLLLKPLTLPQLGPNDVKIRIKAVGICGTDVHFLKTMGVGAYAVKEPMVIGHECAGIVEEVGSDVRTLVPGDRVAVEPGVPCWQCRRCIEGRYNICPDSKNLASPPIHGCLANLIVHPASLCFKLPDSLTLEEGAVCEPLSVGVYGCRRANIGPHTKVLVMGAGPIGLVTMLAARAFGAPRIVMADVNADRLAAAKKLGATEVVLVTNKMEDLETEVELIKKAMGDDIDVSFDCAGFTKTMSTALTATRSGGRVCQMGMGEEVLSIPITDAVARREVDLTGVYRYKHTYPLCFELITSGKIDVKPLITHRFGFSQEQVDEAFKTSASGGQAIKVMFNL
ncbi:dehydrogenase [Lithospermum erythrorhizon]|uniref:Dehydrogenase n=1 Tax=Lithospermum erythrorhizon TaxID=34254 RepID=A0AAV3QSV0_LITER